MNDDQLKDYLPHFGDRLAVRHFCQTSVNNNSTDDITRNKRKHAILDRLRKKLCIPQPAMVDVHCEKTYSANDVEIVKKPIRKNALKNTRVVELCWMNDVNGTRRKVRQKDGGGIRKVSVRKDSDTSVLLSTATSLFFPDGESKFGNISSFESLLLDFREEPMPVDVT